MLVLASFVALAGSAQAAESINSYDVVATVQPDALVQFKETIAYDFSDADDRHGIFRNLVLADTEVSPRTLEPTGRVRTYDVQVQSVSVDGMPAQYEATEDAGVLQLRIGDPDTTVTGTHVYVITYTVAHALRLITKQDVDDPQAPSGIAAGDVELFWDLIDNSFDVPIAAASATVAGPSAPLAARCLLGSLGSKQECPIASTGSSVTLGPSSMSSGEFLTTSIVYPAAAFTSPPVEQFEKEQPLLLGLIIGAALFLALVLIPMTLALNWRGRDKGVAVNATPVQFEPPDRLGAVQMAAAWKGDTASMRPRAMVAAIADLAARGQISITEAKHLTVEFVAERKGSLQAWEAQLINQIFAAGTPATLDSYNAALAKSWEQTYRDLVDEAEASGRRNQQGGAPDRRWNWMIVFVALGIIGFIAAQSSNAPAVGIASGAVVIGSIVGWIIARIITPRRETQESARFLMLTLGFRKLLATDAAAARREFAQRLGLPPAAIMATMLPYAIIFSLEDSWVGAFPDLTPEQLQSTGFNVLSVAALSSVVSNASQSASSALTAPSSGSGSGGSAGGGGGGGGGGSW